MNACKVSTQYEWHCAMGHLNEGIQRVAERIQLTDKQRRQCTNCVLNKQTHEIKGKTTFPRERAPLRIVYSDVCGPIDPSMNNGFRYVINFIDDFSSSCLVYVLESKDTADKTLEQFLADVAPYRTVLQLH